MNKFNRELLVLIKEKSNPQGFENTVEQLHHLLFVVEKSEKLWQAHEVINVHKHRIRKKRKYVNAILDMEVLSPFIFLCNLN